MILRYQLEPSLPSVEADATQLRQIVLNLVINASEAIGEKSGVVTVSSGAIDCGPEYLATAWLKETPRPGTFVYIEVSDNGCGMNEDVRGKVFDPFFTTKFTGRGLGLAAVLGIVRGHRGTIKVYSEEGRGSTFKVLLPAVEARTLARPESTGIQAWKSTATVLLVDDEETVRSVGTRMLRHFGLKVLVAADGREGLEVFRAHLSEIRTVVLDMTMPHLNGEETYRALRALDPEVKVILTSGYNEQEATTRFVGKGLAAFIQKPFQLATLGEVLRKVLG
ncbi:MAG: response regulator [Deltaproteobacteria bacterium]|nr:response regulator [Deltaproteobacteria bacterium]